MAFFILLLFTLVSAGNSARAQKAYDILSYKATIKGNQATLQLADGYLLASKLIIRSKFGEQVFAPSADEQDAQGDLRFDAVKGIGKYKDNKGSWLTLKKIAGPKYPAQLQAIYWDGKVQKTFIFKQ